MSAPQNISDNIKILNKDDTYNLMLILLYASSDNPKYSALNELAYLLDHDSFVNFIKYYAGQTIQIPTYDEIQNSLRTLMLYQFYKIDNMEWHDALRAAGFNSEEDSHSAKRRLDIFIKQLDKYEYKLGGLLCNDNKT